jgi:hypothetical protein
MGTLLQRPHTWRGHTYATIANDQLSYQLCLCCPSLLHEGLSRAYGHTEAVQNANNKPQFAKKGAMYHICPQCCLYC